MPKILEVMRKEKKYILSQIEAQNLYAKMNKVFQKDDYSRENEGYTVRSLYFDSIDDTDFFEKEDGYEYRKKIRLRTYSPNSPFVKVEMKEKEGDNQRKQSLLITRNDAEKMIAGDYQCLLAYKVDFAEKLYYRMQQSLYLPKCIVEYRRIAFHIPENDIRLTLDYSICASESDFNLFSENLNLNPVCDTNQVTLEVKYNRFLLDYVKDVINTSNKVQISNSKYCLARKITCNYME